VACLALSGHNDATMYWRAPLAALPLSFIATLAAQAAPEFRDISPEHWAYAPATILAERRIMAGRTPVDFSGEVPLTRYELAQIVSSLYIESGPPATFVVLRDMPPGHEATRDVQRVLGFDLLPSAKPGVFQGEVGVTRLEMVVALDTLLEKNGVAPPARRRQTVFFNDVPRDSTLFKVLDRIVNRFGLIDSRPGARFFASNTVTRFQMLGVLLKALPYLNPQVDREIQQASRPSPRPLAVPSQVPPPAATASPAIPPKELTPPKATTPVTLPLASASPAVSATTAPAPSTPASPTGPILRTRGDIQAGLLFLYSEELPRETGSISAGEPLNFTGGMLGFGGGGGEYWQDSWGGRIQAMSAYVGFDLPHQGDIVPVDMLDTIVNGSAWWRMGKGPDWEFALGGTAWLRSTYNISNQLVSRYYLSADKTYFGAGPSAILGVRMASDLDLVGAAALLPMIQSYNLPGSSPLLGRIGIDLQGRALYRLSDGWWMEARLNALLNPALAGGSQTLLGTSVGVVRDF
jgi:hypothetical protein